MLTIKNTSWLYRFLKFNGATSALNNGRATLCGTFWLTIFHLVKDIGIAILLAVLSVFPSVIIAESMGWIVAQGFLLVYPWWVTLALIVSGAAIWALLLGMIACIIVAICTVWEKTKAWRNSRKFAVALKEELAREEELTWSNIWQKAKIAKRDKLCPLVKVEYVE